MTTEDILNEILSLSKSEIKYRREILSKYTEVLSESEKRIDNVNHMIHNLLGMEEKCHEQMAVMSNIIIKHQENESALLRRIESLENQLDQERKHNNSLLERLISQNQKINENNFKFK